MIALKPKPRPPELTEITLLAQLTTAPIAILAASVTKDEIAHLRSTDAAERARAAGQPGEIATVAKAIELATSQERDIDLLTLEIRDVTELLDLQCIRDAQAPDKPPFPGHDESWRRYLETGGAGAEATYASFLQATYGISPDPHTLHAVAVAMRAADKPLPRPLGEPLWQLEQILLGAEHATQTEH